MVELITNNVLNLWGLFTNIARIAIEINLTKVLYSVFLLEYRKKKTNLMHAITWITL